MAENPLLFSFEETRHFTTLATSYLTDEELRELQIFLLMSPEEGDVIPGSGGVRKLRWRAKGRGKRAAAIA